MPIPPFAGPAPEAAAPVARGVYREQWAVSPSTTIFHIVTKDGIVEWYVPESLATRADALVDAFLRDIDPPVSVKPALKIVG